MQTVLTVSTAGPGLYEFTDEVARFVRDSGVREGLLTLFVQHTSCSLCVQEKSAATSTGSSAVWSPTQMTPPCRG